MPSHRRPTVFQSATLLPGNGTRLRCARIIWLSAVDWNFCKDRGLARLESWLSTDEAF
jgi:hypothetical protein